MQHDISKEPTWLLRYIRKVNSQNGEDGIIEKILEIIPQKSNWCVEFGAWDGIHLSNVHNLIENKGFLAVLIESDKHKFRKLQANCSQYSNVFAINKLVGFTPIDNLDNILENTSIPRNFDVLSIDIDGNDFHVWKAISNYQPKLVVIEFNPTIPTSIDFVQSAEHSVKQGSSLLALVKLGKEKGYELVCVLKYNAFFIRKEYYPFLVE